MEQRPGPTRRNIVPGRRVIFNPRFFSEEKKKREANKIKVAALHTIKPKEGEHPFYILSGPFQNFESFYKSYVKEQKLDPALPNLQNVDLGRLDLPIISAVDDSPVLTESNPDAKEGTQDIGDMDANASLQPNSEEPVVVFRYAYPDIRTPRRK